MRTHAHRSLTRLAPRAGLLILLTALSAWAHHPRNAAAAHPPPPLAMTPEWESANEELQACMAREAFALDNGESDPSVAGAQVAEACRPQVLELADVNAHRTHNPTAAWALYVSTENAAPALGERRVLLLRSKALA